MMGQDDTWHIFLGNNIFFFRKEMWDRIITLKALGPGKHFEKQSIFREHNAKKGPA